MMAKKTAEPTPIQKAVTSALRKFPDAPHRTLAKRLHEDNPALFPTIERARTALRAATGNSGARLRKVVADKTKFRAPRKPGEIPPLPKSEAKPWEPYVIQASRILVLSDIHLPHHDPIALEAALAYGEDFAPDAILINGDLFDFYQLSRFDRDPTKPKILYELESGEQLFAHMRARFGDTPIYYRFGNHDRRWDIYLANNAPLFFEIEEIRNAWHGPAGIVKHRITLVPDKRPVMLGQLMVLHGDEKGRGVSSPVNPARGAFMRCLCNVLEGHGHRQSEHTERTADNKIIACWSTGGLMGMWPEWALINKWSHGFATVCVESSGEYQVELKRIIDGKCY